jgi:hypothetical protein
MVHQSSQKNNKRPNQGHTQQINKEESANFMLLCRGVVSWPPDGPTSSNSACCWTLNVILPQNQASPNLACGQGEILGAHEWFLASTIGAGHNEKCQDRS